MTKSIHRRLVLRLERTDSSDAGGFGGLPLGFLSGGRAATTRGSFYEGVGLARWGAACGGDVDIFDFAALL